MFPGDLLPDLHRPRGLRLDALSVVLTRHDRGTRIDTVVPRAHAAARAVADDHEVVVLDRSGARAPSHPSARVLVTGPGEDLRAAAAVAEKEWIVLADARRAGALAQLGRCLEAAADHPIVLGRRIGAPPLEAPARRAAHPFGLLPRSTRRRVVVRTEEFPFVLLRRDLARRLGVVAGSHLPAADLAVLAVLLDARAAIVRVHDRPACRPSPAPGSSGSGTGAGGPPGVARHLPRRRP